MAVPKRRKTRARRDQRRAHHDKIVVAQLEPCANCGEMIAQHRVCPSCGYYKGRQVIEPREEALG